MCDIHNYCRFCLDTSSEHISILKDSVIQLHIRSCLAFYVEDDDLPKSACMSCLRQLEEFYKYQLSAKCSQEWLESIIREKNKKEHKILLPIPGSEYNSDSLLEFLNHTENIDEYLNSLGKEEIHLDGMFDNVDFGRNISPKKRDDQSKYEMNMEVDVLDSHFEIVKELLEKETNIEKSKVHKCNACAMKFDNQQRLTQHSTKCNNLGKYCTSCDILFDSKQKLVRHRTQYHPLAPCTCNCGQTFKNKDKLVLHYKDCFVDFAMCDGCEFRCRECGLVFKDKVLMYNHAKQHVMKSENRMCVVCGHNFIGDTAVMLHKKKAHPDRDDVLFRCKVCHKTATSHHELYSHIQKQHTLAIEPQSHLCDTCGNSFATRASLMRHCHIHATNFKTEANSKETVDLMCEFCGVLISCKDVMSHMKEHSDKLPK